MNAIAASSLVDENIHKRDLGRIEVGAQQSIDRLLLERLFVRRER